MPEIETKQNVIDLPWMQEYDRGLKGKLNILANALADQVNAIKALQAVNNSIEGYIRVAEVSDPALSYKVYARQSDFGSTWRHIFYPCLVGTMLSGSSTVGQILHVLKKLGARVATAEDTGFTVGQAVWEDLDGTPHAIDGSEGDVMICNITPYYTISGHYTISGTEFDVFLRSLEPFEYNGITVEKIEPCGESPDYCVMHKDSDNVNRMHSVYNPAWNGSYSAPDSVVGKYVFADDGQGGISETYDSAETLIGGAGGCHSTNIALYDGEQYSMNNNVDTTKCVPWMNKTARCAELFWANLAAEGGTFDSHKASLFGSGFSANDPATAAADWDESASGAKNGARVADKDGVLKYFSFASNMKSWSGKSGDFYTAQMMNDWRNPLHCMEAYRALCYAVQHGVGELEWFTFEGNKYKWRSVPGFDGPAQGEATAVVWKMLSTKAASNVLDPTDKTTSIEGNRIDFLISVGLYHGVTTQVSPSWWMSGLIFTEDENCNYEAYMQRDQSQLIKSENGEKLLADSFNFETLYDHVGSFTYGSGYRKNYSNDCLMLPDKDANKAGDGLHTYVCGFNYFTGGAASAGKKVVRGFRRGNGAYNAYLSPLYVVAYYAPSYASSSFAFGTCCRIVTNV